MVTHTFKLYYIYIYCVRVYICIDGVCRCIRVCAILTTDALTPFKACLPGGTANPRSRTIASSSGG